MSASRQVNDHHAGLLDLIARVDNVPIGFEDDCSPYYRLLLAPDPRTHGYLHPNTVSRMPWPECFEIDNEEARVVLKEAPTDMSFSDYATTAFQRAIDAAIKEDIFPTMNAMHSEPFVIMGARGFVEVERFAAPLLGIATRGAHLTCYVAASDGLKVWAARRSSSLFTYPGLLDSTVAGGVKSTQSPLDCILSEAEEEASLPRDLVSASVRSAGAITLACRSTSNNLFHAEVLYAYDMELPPLVRPRPNDGEVADFLLIDCPELLQRMRAGEFKPNVCAVMIDFLIRHGEIKPENAAEYIDLCVRLRRRLPVPTRPDRP